MKKLLYPLVLCVVVNAGTYAQDWHIAGNSGTTPGTHFVGTTDGKALMFKVNNQRSGYIDYAANKANTSLGYQALKSPSGISNVAVGYKAAFSNSSGNGNVAVGGGALYFNTIKSNLVAIGDSALYNNGLGATQVYQSTANVAVGSKALYSNKLGFYNVATGSEAMYSNTNGDANTASGWKALYYNTTGYSNTAIGAQALFYTTGGVHNTAIGDAAGSVGVSSSFSTFLGSAADQSVPVTLNNSMALGYGSRVYASNQVRIGNANIISIGGYAPWTELSDARFKSDIKEDVKGLAFINKLKPVTYRLKVHELYAFLNPNRKPDAEDVQYKAFMSKAMAEKEKEVYTGFIAQEVEKAAKDLNYNFNGVDAPKNEYDHYGLRYSVFVVPLVKAVQELSQENEQLKKQITAQQQINEALENRLAKLESVINTNSSSYNHQYVSLSSAALAQNVPNPATANTVISYTLPKRYQSAKIMITDHLGKTIKEIPVSGIGGGKIDINTAALASGTYQYSLIVDGQPAITKSMVIAK